MRTLQNIPGNPDLFYSPFTTTLVKAEEHNDKWEVYLEASNETKDQEEEVLLCKALKDTADYYLTHGILSWDHKHKQTHDPGFIIGEPTDVAFTDRNQTLIKGFLYKENTIAQGLWKNLMSNATRIGASVGGGILRKAADASKGIAGLITKVIWDEVALTHKPVNDATLGRVSIIPFAEFAKSLMAGSGVDAGSFTGGRALTGEVLQGNKVDELSPEKVQSIFKSLLGKVKDGSIASLADVVEHVNTFDLEPKAAASVIEFLTYKIPSIQTR